MKTEPNNAMERSLILVTVRADARPAPSVRLAHLGVRHTLKMSTPYEIVANFRFPDGCKEKYGYAVLPALPRIGDYIQSYRPQSGRYLVKSVAFEINDDNPESRATVLIELEATDKVSNL